MTARWACFTDLDGTLLDHDSYDWHPAEPALQALAERDIPVIAVTSKTRLEWQALRRDIPYLAPLAGCENGAVVVDDRGSDGLATALGRPLAELIAVFERVRQSLNAPAIGFHEASDQQVSDWTGLSLNQSQLARQREGALPVYWPAGVAGRAEFKAALEAAGVQTLEGGRFLHLASGADKGTALQYLVDKLAGESRVRSLALGDGGNDDAMLAIADLAVRIPPAHGAARAETLSNVVLAPQPGPAGWNRSVLDLLDRFISKEP
ncbi:HAD-IIB family hydrolase [Saccharospirillum mangrovi]|uniref:HAD-IIB family hydrolase n=1 Tax=Saccharospirillum mangrovi TaxID=2161747 RepID=UPI0013007123|nr:HAD-IIB family hydrolase [Saccharospirillum mangrovi]